jgi:drug/metabolite transporter superfamily protein YnfA
MVGDIVLFVLVAAAACSTCWVLWDALRRGLPRRKALTWAALQWIEFPLFLWLYHRIRPGTRRQPTGSDSAG